MEDKIAGIFYDIEAEKRKELFSLMRDWEKTVTEAKRGKMFLYDGFFPGYYETTLKVLFIGREPRLQASNDYIYNAIEHFKNGTAVNSVPYWKRIICMYNIIKNHGIIDGTTAAQIVQPMIEQNNYGFAVVNISKYHNDSDNYRFDLDLARSFFEDSKLDLTNFLEKEITILDPDLMISSNLWDCGIDDCMDRYLGKRIDMNKKIMVGDKCAAAFYNVEIGNKTFKLIDLYHFSFPYYADMDYYYKPISELLKNVFL